MLQSSLHPPESTPLGRGREAVMSQQALTAITAQVHSTSMLLSHSTQVQLQSEVSFVGSVGTGEVFQQRKGKNLAGVGRGTSCPQQCLIGGSEDEGECRLPAGRYRGVLSLNEKDQALCKGLGTIQVRIKT